VGQRHASLSGFTFSIRTKHGERSCSSQQADAQLQAGSRCVCWVPTTYLLNCTQLIIISGGQASVHFCCRNRRPANELHSAHRVGIAARSDDRGGPVHCAMHHRLSSLIGLGCPLLGDLEGRRESAAALVARASELRGRGHESAPTRGC